MATPPPGIDQRPEQSPQQVVYRRFASETRTVQVTSTAPWTVKDLRPDPTKGLSKEHLDKALKWTNELWEQPLKKDQGEEKCNTPKRDESTIAQDKVNSVHNARSSQDKAHTTSGEDAHIGGRRDKVVGGAAKMFEDPLNSRKNFNGEEKRRNSENDMKRFLSSANLTKPESRRLTEPAIGKHTPHFTIKDSQLPTDNQSAAFKSETKRSAFPDSARNAAKTVNDSLQATSNKSDVHVGLHVEIDKSDPANITLAERRQNMDYSEPQSRKEGHSQTKTQGDISCNSPISRPESTREAKVQANKNQTSSNAATHVVTDKSTLLSHLKINPAKDTSVHFDNTTVTELKKCEKEKVSQGNSNKRRSENTSSFFHSENTRQEETKVEKNKASSNTFGLHSVSEDSALKCESEVAEQGNSLFLRTQNTRLHKPKSEDKLNTTSDTKKNSSFLCSGDTKSSPSRILDTSASRSKTDGNKSKLTGTLNTSDCNHSTVKYPYNTEAKDTPRTLCENIGEKVNNKKEETTVTPAVSSSNEQTKFPKDLKCGLQERTVVEKTRHKENQDSAIEKNVFTRKNETDESVTHSAPSKNSLETDIHGTSLNATKLNQVQKCLATAIEYSSLPSSITELPTTDFSQSLSIIKDGRDEVPSKKNVNGKVALKSAIDSKTGIKDETLTVPTQKDTISSVSAATQQNPSIPKGMKSSVASQPKPLDKRFIESKINSEAGRSRSLCCPLKHEPREPLASRPVTRSKSDVGEGNVGRTARPARKSCAERRCCGAQSRPWQEPAAAAPAPAPAPASAPARARSLSRAPPMGSTASLAPQNKSSWTTQRALESEVQQLKRELQMHEAEELRLHREIHKLRSVLQQATSFGEETGGTGDPNNGALLASLQDRHGMAGATGVPLGTSKKQGVSGESCEPESVQVPRHEKDIKSRKLIKAAILDNDFLKNLARCQIRELVDCMYPQRVQAGSYVIREGEAGSHLYVLDDGEMEVLKEGTVLGRMGPGKAFGELAILYNCTRTASIRAVSDLQVWVLDRRTFQQIMMRTGMQRLEDNIAFLRSVPLLRGINEKTLARIADALEPEFYPTDEYIVRQGARGNTFFIISGGSVQVTQRGANGFEVVLRTLGRGEYFGEQALLHDDCRTASVRALLPGVDCLTLDRESFNALIGSLSELHHKDYAEETRSQSSRTSFNYDCRKEDETVSSLHLDDLRPLGTLGVGGFGCVRLVMAPSGRSYALKCLSKRHVAATGQQEHVAAERDVLLAARSPFIVRLYRTFRDEANVYLLLEACLGGEVWALLREHEHLPDKAARFIAACVLEALEYLHSRDIVYRDLKPENLVMDADGYVKLVDFGFCKRLPGGCKTWTFCGTPEYVAPEVILNRGHDRAVDYWALGVLIYELVTGAPPFAAADPMATYNLILLGMESAVMPKYMSRTAAHLIRRLCRAAPSERLGYQRGGFTEVKAHRWFQDFDWDALRAQTMTPPIKPQVSGPTDMSNFYPITLNEELAPAELSHWDADF